MRELSKVEVASVMGAAAAGNAMIATAPTLSTVPVVGAFLVALFTGLGNFLNALGI